jgi:transcription elongation GreA/GreB family factor
MSGVSTTTTAPSIPPEFQELIDGKKLDALEALWAKRMEEDAEALPVFFAVAAAVKKKASGGVAVKLLRFLADFHDQGSEERIQTLLELARMSPKDPEVRKELAASLKSRFGKHPAYAAVVAKFPVESAPDPAEAAGRIARWLRFRPDGIYYMPGRGAGRLVEMKPALDVFRLEVQGAKLPLSLVSAERNLVELPEGHFLRRKVEDPASLAALAESDPPETLRQLLESFGGRSTVQEVRDHLSGIVPDAKWSSFWSAARKHKQVVVSGTAKSSPVVWSESVDAAEDSVRRSFEKAAPAAKIDLARKHAKRSKALAALMAESLASEARKAGSAAPALAWELSQAAARLAPGSPEAFPAADLLAVPELRRALAEIRDHQAREKALEAVRASRADWAEIFIEQISREEDARVLGTLFSALGERAADFRRKILRSPRTAPRAFVWLLERMHADGRADSTALFVSLTDAMRMDEFSGLRARLKELFEPGGLAVALVRLAGSEEEARDLLHALDRVAGLEEHRRATVREALLMKFPELRAPAREYLYATVDAIEARRKEMLHLKQVELPANAEQMRAAKEHGDLSENFEYHAARQKHEYLSARIATLADELSRTRSLDPSRIDANEVRVGTRVRLRDEGGAEREIVILGPWDSKPESLVYSYQSEFAQRLLGARTGDRIQLAEGPVEVVAIAPWA